MCAGNAPALGGATPLQSRESEAFRRDNGPDYIGEVGSEGSPLIMSYGILRVLEQFRGRYFKATVLKSLSRIVLLFFSNPWWIESERGLQSTTPKVLQIRYTPTGTSLYGGFVNDTVEYHH